MARIAGLDQAVIVASSLDLVDAEGLDALTMRRLSAKLGVTPMAIYHHVAGKEQLLDLVVDESLGALPVVDEDAEPREALVAWFMALYELLVAHPALAQAVAGRRIEGLAATRVAAGVLRIVEREGLDDQTAAELMVSLFSFTMGGSLYRISRTAAGAKYGERRIAAADQDPVARRIRDGLSGTDSGNTQFRGGLRRLVNGYLPRG